MNSILSYLHVYPDKTELATATATQIAQDIIRAIEERGNCCIALSGGQTPRPVYHNLSKAAFGASIDWSKVQIFFVDERMVPPSDPASNFGMVQQELLSHIKIPTQNVHRIQGELDAMQAGEMYDKELRIAFPNAVPQFDLILLGVGEEGHTASLFPGSAALHETERYAVANFVAVQNAWRVTLTLPVINNARKIIFLVSGIAKSQIISALSHAKTGEQILPATMVQPTAGTTQWMLDTEAASLL